MIELPPEERPRERLLGGTAEHLTDAELLAVLLGGGTREHNAVGLAQALHADHGGLRALAAALARGAVLRRGIGPARRAGLIAAFELGRRCIAEELRERDTIRDPAHCRDYLRARLQDRPAEVFMALFLDQRHRLIACEELFRGTIDAADVHPREVVRRCLELTAAALIVAHNHPSGYREPSAADIALTRRLREALTLVDVRLLDHFIVGHGEPLSMAERGLV